MIRGIVAALAGFVVFHRRSHRNGGAHGSLATAGRTRSALDKANEHD